MADNNNLNFYMTFDSSSAKRDIESIRKSYSAMAREIGKGADTPLLDNVIDSGKELYGVFKALSPQLKKATEARQRFAAAGNAAGIAKENIAIEKITQSTKAFTKALTQLKSTRTGLSLAGQPKLKSNAFLTRATTSPKLFSDEPLLKMATELSPNTSYKTLSDLTNGATIASAKKNWRDIADQMARFGQNTKKSDGWFKKLIGRIRNISIYRAIRTGIKWITSGFREGLENLAQYSDSINSTMSNLNGSLTQVRNSLGVALGSTLQALEPIIVSVADAIIDVINSFNLALAQMQGKSVYTVAKKQVDDYAQSLRKANKFGFDQFEVLSGGGIISPLDMFSESSVSKDANAMSDTFVSILTTIKQIGESVGALIKRLIDSGALGKIMEIISRIVTSLGDIVISIIDSGALDTIIDAVMIFWDIGSKILGVIAGIINKLNEMGALKGILLGIAAAWVAIKIAAIGAAIASAAAKIAEHPIAGTIALIAGFAALTGMAATINSAANNVPSFADGGFTTANFIATNENGKREWVGRNAGATAIVNDTQMSDIMYQAVRRGSAEGMVQAIYETGLADAVGQKLTINGSNINDSAFARAIFPALKAESIRRGGNQL